MSSFVSADQQCRIRQSRSGQAVLTSLVPGTADSREPGISQCRLRVKQTYLLTFGCPSGLALGAMTGIGLVQVGDWREQRGDCETCSDERLNV